MLNSSDDRGEIWTEPVRIHADSSDTTIARRDELALAVNNAGIVGLAWMETHEQGQTLCQQVRFTASLDGGRTFLPNRRVSDADSCPDSAANGAVYDRAPRAGIISEWHQPSTVCFTCSGRTPVTRYFSCGQPRLQFTRVNRLGSLHRP